MDLPTSSNDASDNPLEGNNTVCVLATPLAIAPRQYLRSSDLPQGFPEAPLPRPRHRRRPRLPINDDWAQSI